jgi:NAD(P)-dependent dehydrogenase (short-subunit alcohol dehydrogenase family)
VSGGGRYAGKRVVVSGAASGTGMTTATLLVDWGAEVHTIDAAKPDVRGLASFTECDLRDIDQVDAAVERIGRYVHVLVNCAPHGPGIEHLVERVAADMLEGSAIVCAGGPDAEAYVARRASDMAARGIDISYADPPLVAPQGERAD